MGAESEKINWVEMNEQWKSSGLSQEKFCESRGISYSTFVYHRGKLLEKSRKGDQGRFSPVRVMAPPVIDGAASLVLRLPTGICLDIPSSGDLAQVKQVLSLLGVAGC